MGGDQITLHGLFKVGTAEHMRALRERGEVFMQPLERYRTMERDQERADPYEGVSVLLQPPRLVRIRLDNLEIPPCDLTRAVRISNGADRACAVYCMTSITDTTVNRHLRLGTPLIDPRLRGFGDIAIVVTDARVFIERLTRALRRAGLESEGRLVEYLSVDSHHGDWGPFRKSHWFEHQQEWRLAVRNPPSDPLVLHLGSLEDCTVQTTTDEFVRKIEARYCQMLWIGHS